MEGAGDQKDIVVLAVDGSKPSELAFDFYLENVSRPGYFLHLVHHSNYWKHYEPEDGAPSAKHVEEMTQQEISKVEAVEDKYKKLLTDKKIDGDFFVLRGKDAWHDIIQHQEKHKAVMIVMGTRGQGALSRTFRGSVSDSVVHHASVPVLVCCHPKH